VSATSDQRLFLYALILLGLILFGFFLLSTTGLLALALTSDRSYISWVIFALYGLATLHWLARAWSLSEEHKHCAAIDQVVAQDGSLSQHDIQEQGYVGGFITSLKQQSQNSAQSTRMLIDTLGDQLTNTHAPGHFIADLLLKLGLTGTVIGFILMLLPIGQIEEFDPSLMQQLLSAMSGGMAVALYTTLAGLVTSTLLKMQYYLLDASLADLVNKLTVLSQLKLAQVKLVQETPDQTKLSPTQQAT